MQTKQWKPRMGWKYYYINEDGEISYFNYWRNDFFDNIRLSIGNVFRTKGDAKLNIDEIIKRMK